MSTALQTQPKDIKALITGDYFRQQVALAIPRHMTADRFCRVALSALTRNPTLANCTQSSLLKCMLTLSELGLEPDGRRAHLIPFKDNKSGTTECTLIVDYKGLAELAQRSGTISNIHADVVCENDDFVYDRGQLVTHRVDFKKPRGKPYAAYALVRFKDGGEKCEVMSQDQIYAVRDKSSGWRAYKAGYSKQNPWGDEQSEPEMWKKTVFRRASKWLVLSPEIADALEKVEREDVDMRNVTPEPLGLELPKEPESPPQVEPPPQPQPRKRKEQPSPTQQPTQAPVVSEIPQPPSEAESFEAAVPEAPKAPTPIGTLQEQLAEFCTVEQISWAVFQKWADQSGNLPNAMSLTGFEQIGEADCTRFLRARVGLLNQLRNTQRLMAK